tara:strand:- start:168 stop:1265 length:1098 start_codon:yes stop_codon:yes gene_type:complete
MSRGDLQEMEVKTQQSSTAVNSGAAKGDPMPTTPNYVPDGQGSVEDLGGPTPENSKPDDNSNMLKTPTATIKQVKDVITKNAGKADPMPTAPKYAEEAEADESQEVVAEEESTEATETETEAVDLNAAIEEDVNALLSGEDLSEEFKEKAKTIFEASINAKITDIENQLNEAYEQKLVEEVESIKVELTERTDSYLEYVAQEWLDENAIAIEKGIKSEMTESFMEGMKKLFEEHYVTLPEDKYDVLENMVDKLDEMETKLNEQIEKNVTLNQKLGESTAQTIFNNVAEGLAVSQKEKLQSLAESVEFESEESYRGKIETLKESYFGAKKTTTTTSAPQELKEEAAHVEPATGAMAAYLDALGRMK